VLRSILDSSREAVLIADSDMRIAAANRPAADAFARFLGPLENRRLSEIIRDFSLHHAFRKAISESAASDFRLDLIGFGGRSFDVHVAPLELEGRRHAIGVFYDVTKLERLERARQEFLSNISHELRTPLTSILAFVETLEDGAIDDKENNRRFLNVIRRNAEKMHMLIADILELSQIESGKVSVDKTQVSLARHVEEIFTSLSSKAAERDVELVNEVGSDVRVLADTGRLEQMLTNLIDNAIKFNRRGGSVTVEHEERNGKALISVADTGEGILSTDLPRIFERFYRTDRGRTRDVGGTGLGLAIVKHLALLHGGEISASSSLGRGTTFLIQLPLQ
jgi:two-component system phosphate regulon sensor histidine kinase PhoR